MTNLKKKDIANKVIFLFIVGSIFGTYYEGILYTIKYFIWHGEFIWIPQNGLLYGPFSPIYGIGTVFIYLLFYIKNNKWYQTFLYGALFGGIYEFMMGFLQEKIWGTISWDYSNEFLNIGGRTTVPFMIFWGLLILAFVYLVFPPFDKLYAKIKSNVITEISFVLFVVILIDILISVTAVTRQTFRKKGYKPATSIGRFCDEFYTDDYLKTIYRNSIEVKKA